MKYYLSDIIPRLKKFSARLDQSAFLVDKPWIVTDKSSTYDKLIFRRDGRVHMSSNGDVSDGTWEYLPEAEGLLIDYGNKKRLYRHQYLDEAVLALKLDGVKHIEDYYLLANEKVIPDLDVSSYLKSKYLYENNIKLAMLENGEEMELHLRYGATNNIDYADALVNGSPAQDGSYFYRDQKKLLNIRDGKVVIVRTRVEYNGIKVWQYNDIPTKGDLCEGIKEGTFKFGKYTIQVSNGKVSKVKHPWF